MLDFLFFFWGLLQTEQMQRSSFISARWKITRRLLFKLFLLYFFSEKATSTGGISAAISVSVWTSSGMPRAREETGEGGLLGVGGVKLVKTGRKHIHLSSSSQVNVSMAPTPLAQKLS